MPHIKPNANLRYEHSKSPSVIKNIFDNPCIQRFNAPIIPNKKQLYLKYFSTVLVRN